MKGIKNGKIKIFVTKKVLPVAAVVVIAVTAVHAYSLLKPHAPLPRVEQQSIPFETETVKRMTLKQSLTVPGLVVSSTNSNLSFPVGGVVKSLSVHVGDFVEEGQVLATLDQGEALAALTQAQGALDAAKARYKKIVDKASNEEIALAQSTVKNAQRDYDTIKSQQDVLVANAYATLLNSTPQAVPSSSSSDYVAPTISGNYTLGKEGEIHVLIYNSGYPTFTLSGLTTGTGRVTVNTPQPLGKTGLSIVFATADTTPVTEWIISIPNKQAPNYLSNYNEYQSAIKTRDTALSAAQSTLNQAATDLATKNASPKQVDIDLAKADILSAQGQVQSAQVQYDNTIVRAPSHGTVTKIDTAVGEDVEAKQKIIVLQDIAHLSIESKVPEAMIAKVKVGQTASFIFDALGADKVFSGKIIQIDPSPETIDDSTKYKIKISLIGAEKMVRSGMNAAATIEIAEKQNVLAIPSTALITKNNKTMVRVVTDQLLKKYRELQIQTGITGEGNFVEVTKGLSEGQTVVIVAHS